MEKFADKRIPPLQLKKKRFGSANNSYLIKQKKKNIGLTIMSDMMIGRLRGLRRNLTMLVTIMTTLTCDNKRGTEKSKGESPLQMPLEFILFGTHMTLLISDGIVPLFRCDIVLVVSMVQQAFSNLLGPKATGKKRKKREEQLKICYYFIFWGVNGKDLFVIDREGTNGHE